jgi:hypothetical protein
MAAFASAKPGLKAFAHRGAKGAVFGFGFAGRAGQPAKDTGGADADKGLAIVTVVARQQGAVQGGRVWQVKQHRFGIASLKCHAAENRALISD